MNILYGVTGIITLIIFGYINSQIIVNDFQHRKIPNKQLLALLALLPLWWFTIAPISIDSIGMVLVQTGISLIVAFLLYYFQLWGAGDAKYLLILSLYIPDTSMIVFIGNITIITLVLLSRYMIWFLYHQVSKVSKKRVLKEVVTIKNIKYTLNQYKKQVFIFLVIFVCIRLGRIHVVGDLYDKYSTDDIVMFGSAISPDYIFFGIIGAFIGVVVLLRYLIIQVLGFLEKMSLNVEKIKNILMAFVSILLCIYIIVQFYQAPYETSQVLMLILTVYLLIVLCIIGGRKLIVMSLEMGERYTISLQDLYPGIMIDNKHLAQILLHKKHIVENIGYDLSVKTLEKEDIKKLRKICKLVNTNIDRNKKAETYIDHIIAVRTVAYAPYILAGFFISFIFGNTLIESIVQGVFTLFIK